MVTAVIASTLATKFDVQWNLYNAGERLILFTEAVTWVKTAPTPIDFSTALPGLVPTGRRMDRRRFDREAGARALDVVVVPTRRVTAAKLATVTAYAIVPRGATSATAHRCRLVGVPENSSEPAFRFTSIGRTFAYSLEIDVDNLLLASGDHLLLEQGGNLLLGGA
jgi:hypothetical protein